MCEGVAIIIKVLPHTKEKSKARINLRRQPAKGQKLIFASDFSSHMRNYIFQHCQCTHIWAFISEPKITYKLTDLIAQIILRFCNFSLNPCAKYWMVHPQTDDFARCQFFKNKILTLGGFGFGDLLNIGLIRKQSSE